jgi:hypothetical protein
MSCSTFTAQKASERDGGKYFSPSCTEAELELKIVLLYRPKIERPNRHRKIDQSDLLPAFLVYSMYGYSFILYGDACSIESLSGEQEASADLSTFLLFIREEVKVNQSDVLLNLHTSEASARDGGKYFSPSCTEAEFLNKIQNSQSPLQV